MEFTGVDVGSARSRFPDDSNPNGKVSAEERGRGEFLELDADGVSAPR